MGATTREQTSFRLRNDDGSESGASWKQDINIDATINVDENFRIRFGYTIGGMDGGQACQLEYNLAGGGWNPVNATSIVVRSFTTPNVADNATITEQLDQGNTFQANTTPNGGFDEVNGLVNTQDLALGEECEVEYCVQIRSADVVDAQTLQLRITRAGTVFDTYTSEPTITVSEDLSPEEAESFSQGQQQPVMRAAGIVFAAALIASGLAIHDPETIGEAGGDTSIEDWWQPWPEQVRDHPGVAYAAALDASGLIQPPQIDSAVRVTWARLEVPLADAVEPQDDIEHWFQAFSEPVPPQAGLHASQQRALVDDQETIGDAEAAPDTSIEDWWRAFAVPTLRQPGLHASLQAQPTNPDALTDDVTPPAPPARRYNPMMKTLGKMMNR